MFTALSVSLFCSFYFPFPCFLAHHSIFCKMSALVRHRVSLFGKKPASHQNCYVLCFLLIFLITFTSSNHVSSGINKSITHIFYCLWWFWFCDADVIKAVCAGTDASAIVNCLHILARSLDARYSTSLHSIYLFFCTMYGILFFFSYIYLYLFYVFLYKCIVV